MLGRQNLAVGVIEIRVLGSLEIVGPEGPVSLSARKHRRLLAALAICVGELVSRDALIDAVWGDAPPASAWKLLQVYISQLRKALPDEVRIRTGHGGYVLELGKGMLDAAHFERLLDDGRAAVDAGNEALAVSLLRRALGLWRGPAFGELAHEQFARAEAQRLEELRLLAREEQFAAELALGRHDELLADLSRLARAEPLRERLQAQSMLALYRCGRQAEALEVYTTAYANLHDTLGLEPGADLQELQRRILQHDPSLAIASAARPVQASLAAPPNALLGRERDLEQLRELVLRDDVRLLVLTGAGGSGKTRLALETARASAASFANGVVSVALAPLRDPAHVIGTIAQACGVDLVGGQPIKALTDALSTRELLLVLDNFEHLRVASLDLVKLLAGAPRLTLLVTSRAVLHVSGEHVYPVDPLPIDAACALFIVRAREADPRFVPGPESQDAIAQICTRLDGLPLAIELAAARTNVLSPPQLLGRLDPCLPLLAGGPRDLPARQQTIRATLEWSHNLLASDEQRLFRRLAVFAGGFDVSAAERVCDGSLETLGSLIEQSLVRRKHDGRFGMLETIREFALEALDASEDACGVRREHVAHFLAIAQSANLREDSEGEQRYELISEDRDNIRAALSWAIDTGTTALGLELAIALETFWLIHAVEEGKGWLEALLASEIDLPLELQARGLRACGMMTRFAGDALGGEALYEQSLAAYRAAGNEHGIGLCLLYLAACSRDRNDIRQARELIEQSLEILRRVGNRSDESAALAILGKIECDDANHQIGLGLLERAVAIAEEVGSSFWQAYWLADLCEGALELGRIKSAEAWGRQSLALCRRIGDRQTPLHILTLLARAALQDQRLAQAGQLWGAVEVEMKRAQLGWWLLAPLGSRFPTLRDPALAGRRHLELVRVRPRRLRDQKRDGPGNLAHVGQRLPRLVAGERLGLGRLDRRVDREQRHVDALAAQLLGGGLHEGSRGERAGRPQPAPRIRPARRATGDLDQCAAPARLERRGTLGQEHEGLLGHGHRPAAKQLEIGLGHVAASERPTGGPAIRADRVDHGVDRAVLLASPRQRATQRRGLGCVGGDGQCAALAHSCQGVLAARHSGRAPAPLEEVIDDRSAQVARAQDHHGLAHRLTSSPAESGRGAPS